AMALADDAQVPEHRRVPDVVDGDAVLELDDEARGLAEIDGRPERGAPVAARVVGVDHGHADAPGIHAATLVHAHDLGGAEVACLEPEGELMDRWPDGAGPARDRDGVGVFDA